MFCLIEPWNKKLVISADISPKYRISAATNTILLIESRLGKKIRKIDDISVKYWKILIFRRNIERIHHARVCWKFQENLDKISEIYRRYR